MNRKTSLCLRHGSFVVRRHSGETVAPQILVILLLKNYTDNFSVCLKRTADLSTLKVRRELCYPKDFSTLLFKASYVLLLYFLFLTHFSATSYLWDKAAALTEVGYDLAMIFCDSSSLTTGVKQVFPAGWQPRSLLYPTLPACLLSPLLALGPPQKCSPPYTHGSWPRLWASVPPQYHLKPAGLSVKTKDEYWGCLSRQTSCLSWVKGLASPFRLNGDSSHSIC